MTPSKLLKIMGAGITAGITGGYLAIRMRRPQKSYSDFLRIYASLSVDFLRRLESTLLETMLSETTVEDRGALESLLDRSATFNEKMRFFQQRLPAFEDLALKALDRFYQSRGGGLSGSPLESRVLEFGGEGAGTGAEQLFAQLEEAFELSMAANIPDHRKTEMVDFIEKNPGSSLTDQLRYYRNTFPGFGGVLFDAISRFESKVYNTSLP